MPGNEVGDRVHNFFAQDNLSQGQHSQVVDGNWTLNNNLWVGNQKQIGLQSSNPKDYNPFQSELERGHVGPLHHVPHGFNFAHTALRPEFARGQSQNQQPNSNGYMYGRQVFQSRPDEANFLGVDTESDRNNVRQRGFPIYDSHQGGASEQITKNSVRSDTSDTPASFDLFGGQQQMNSQHPVLLQPLQQQQVGYEVQQLQQQLMFKKMQEFQRQKELLQMDPRQQNLGNQVSSFGKQTPGSLPHGLINGIPISEASSYPWAEPTGGNTDWLPHASPAIQGSSSGVVFSSEQAQAPHAMGFTHQLVDQSLYGVPVSSSRGTPNQFPHTASDKTPIHQMPTYNNSFSGNQYAVSVFPEQVTVPDGSSVNRQGFPGKGLFGHVSGQGPNFGINKEHLQQLDTIQRNAAVQDVRGSQEVIGTSEILQDKTAMEATSSDNAVSLDPTEEKILFGSDDNIWDAFGKSTNISGGASNLLEGGGLFSGLPSMQSGSWSALMQSAVAESSSNDIGVQEEWAGASLQNPELLTGSQKPSTLDDSKKRQTALEDNNLRNASELKHGSLPPNDGSNMGNNYQSAMGFSPYGKIISYEHSELLQIDSSERLNQQSSGGSKWLNPRALQKQHAEASQSYENASLSMGMAMNRKNSSGHWHVQQGGPFLPGSTPNNWTGVENIPQGGEATLSINDNENSLRHSQGNDQKRVTLDDATWRFHSLHTSNFKSEPVKSSIGSPQINKEHFGANTITTVPNSSTIHVSEDRGQFLPDNRQLSYWKNVDSTMKSKGIEGSGRSQRNLNKGPQVSESSFNSSDKEEHKMHEMENNSRRENSNDSYRSNLGHLAKNAGSRENLLTDAGDSRSIPGGKQISSNQAGRKNPVPRKFQYHPMGNNLDEDVEVPFGTRQGGNSQAMTHPASRALKGQDQGYFGPSKFFGQLPRSSAESGKDQVPDLQVVSNLSDDTRSRGCFPGHMPNMSASSDRAAGLSTQNTISQPSQNMLELLHKVDQSRDLGAGRNFSSFEPNLSSEMPETENSEGSVGQLQRSQSSNSQGFGLQLAPPSQRSALPNVTSNPSTQAIPDLKEKGHSKLSPSYSVSLPPSQEVSREEFKNDRIGTSGQIVSEAPMHKMNIPSALNSGFPYSRNQLQNQQVIVAKGQVFPNHSGQQSFDVHAHNKQADESCSLPSQSVEGSLSSAAGYGLYDNVWENHPHDRFQSQQSSTGEKLPVSQPCTASVTPQDAALSKVAPNLWTNISAQQHHFGTQARKGHSNLSQSHQLSILESNSLVPHNVENQDAERRGTIPSKLAAGSMNSQGFVSAGEQPAKECSSPLVSYGMADQPPMINGPLEKESLVKHLSDASPVNPTSTQRDLEAFGRSLKPNNFHQSYSLLNQMRAMRSTDNDLNNRGLKRLKGSDNDCNNMMGDASASRMTVPSGDSKMLRLSGPAGIAEKSVSHLVNAPSRDMLELQNESQSHMASSSATSIKPEHSHISPQMAPSWFDQYGTFKNGLTLPTYDSQKAATMKTVEKPFSLGKSSAIVDMHNSKEQVNAAADTVQISLVLQDSAVPSVANDRFSSSPVPSIISDQITLRPKKRKTAKTDLCPWHMEVLQDSGNLQSISVAATDWAKAVNRLPEKVEDDVEDDIIPVVRTKRRLLLTIQLMQQVFRPPPASVMSLDAISSYESVTYFVTQLALGDACRIASSARSHSDVYHSGRNSDSDMSKRSRKIDYRHLSEAVEDFMGRSRKLEDDLLRLDKRASILDLRAECQELEKFSVINRFARFHGRGQADGAEPSSSDIAANAPKPYPQRYVTAVPLPKNLPDRVQCLSL